MSPTNKCAGAGLHGLFPAIDHIALIFRQVRQWSPVSEVVKIAGGQRFAGLDLNWSDFVTIHQQAVDLLTMIVLPKIGLAIVPAMEGALDELIDDQILKKRAFHVVQVDLIFVADAKQ